MSAFQATASPRDAIRRFCTDVPEEGKEEAALSAVSRRFLARHTVRVQVISLPRSKSRWAAAEQHALTHLLAHVPYRQATGDGDDVSASGAAESPRVAQFVLGGGVDASVARDALDTGGVVAMDDRLNAKVWRGWPVCDATDVAKIVNAHGGVRVGTSVSERLVVKNHVPAACHLGKCPSLSRASTPVGGFW